jgi:hypothetical protein
LPTSVSASVLPLPSVAELSNSSPLDIGASVQLMKARAVSVPPALSTVLSPTAARICRCRRRRPMKSLPAPPLSRLLPELDQRVVERATVGNNHLFSEVLTTDPRSVEFQPMAKHQIIL